jgi:hypothetical protein
MPLSREAFGTRKWPEGSRGFELFAAFTCPVVAQKKMGIRRLVITESLILASGLELHITMLILAVLCP